MHVTRGFTSRARASDRYPPGQHDAGRGFPVLSAGPTPRTDLGAWDFTVRGEVGAPASWSWEQFQALPRTDVTVDIHCVTTWSKLDTRWSGVSVDTVLEHVEPASDFVTAFSDGGYTTNLPLKDLTGGRAWLVDTYDGEPLPPEHGGPMRLLVPHLYFWKSAKWVRGLTLTPTDRLGFWEMFGYHAYGDPWKEQRYTND